MLFFGSHLQFPVLGGHHKPREGESPPVRPTIPLRSIVGLTGGLGLRNFYRQRFTLPTLNKLIMHLLFVGLLDLVDVEFNRLTIRSPRDDIHHEFLQQVRFLQ